MNRSSSGSGHKDGGWSLVPFRPFTTALNMTCKQSLVVFGEFGEVVKFATTDGYAAATLVVSSSLSSSGLSHFVATRTTG